MLKHFKRYENNCLLESTQNKILLYSPSTEFLHDPLSELKLPLHVYYSSQQCEGNEQPSVKIHFM